MRIRKRVSSPGAVALILMTAVWAAAGTARLRAGNASIVGAPRRLVDPTPARDAFAEDVDSLAVALERLDSSLAAPERSVARADFRAARRAFKGSEALWYSYSPTVAGSLNGPLPEEDSDSPPAPLGKAAVFQVLEHVLFEVPSAEEMVDARGAIRSARSAVGTFRSALGLLDVRDTSVLDAARLELSRVVSVGLGMFDSNASGDAAREAASSLDGMMRQAMLLNAPPADAGARADQRTLIASLASGAAYLRANPNPDDVNRLRFIVAYVRPAARAIADLRASIDTNGVHARRVWRTSAASPFSAAAFDGWGYAPEYAPANAAAWAALGHRMFFDPQLSGPRSRSCATCHVPSRAFSDGRARALPIDGNAVAPLRNTPGLLNVAFQPALFADQRAGSLEDQVRTVLASASEMESSASLAASRLTADASYAPLVAAAAGRRRVGERDVRVALAAYLRTLTSLESRFDRAARGDTLALTPAERHGFTVFMGKGRCGSCHFAPLFSGVMPPDFVRSELEIIGVPADRGRHAAVDADSGRARVDGIPAHDRAFKTPTLRNVALTAPYMHNGVFETLDEVVDFYNAGGGVGRGERLPGQTLPSRKLGLTSDERRDVVAFLRSLTDSSAMRCQLVTMPSLSCREGQAVSQR
jgi:cytochrome c peroxidase